MLNVIICDAYFLEKFMKWKPLLSLFFFFSLLMSFSVNATSLAPTFSGTSASKAAKTGMVWKGGKWVVNHVSHHKLGYASLAVIGGAFYFRKDIEELVDYHISSDKWSSEKKSILIPKLSKKINNAKPQDKDAVILATQNALMYYMVIYDGESFGRTATDIIDSLGIRDNEFLKNYDIAMAAKKTAVAMISATMATTIARSPKTNCVRGSFNREYIKQKQDNSSSSTTLVQWDVGAYEKQRKITENYNQQRKVTGKPLYDFHKDHIPSKKAIETYLKKRDSLVITKDLRDNIYNNATSVVLTDTIHRVGRTYGGKNKNLIAIDAKNLEIAMVKDFIVYYVVFSLLGQADAAFDLRFTKAYIETYTRNERLCLFIRR